MLDTFSIQEQHAYVRLVERDSKSPIEQETENSEEAEMPEEILEEG